MIFKAIILTAVIVAIGYVNTTAKNKSSSFQLWHTFPNLTITAVRITIKKIYGLMKSS